MRWAALLVTALALFGVVTPSHAFCGFYVAGADAKLFNNATMVVMMRHGMRTVLSMQNNYQGPPERFAMVVPVPVVLQKENVKTLSNDIFDHIDKLAAPRLVEYWEQDPCYEEPEYEGDGSKSYATDSAVMESGGAPPVTVEAQFAVGEYEVVVLSATDASALETWLLDNQYSIPNGAEPMLRPYVESGSKFFVAKVDVTKVTFKGNQAMLSPLRFHYESQDFSLPVRLGLINSSGTQDLIVHILAKERYEVANYPNVTIPTNIDVNDSVRDNFGAFYAALFDATLAKTPRAVVTEYSWAASTCDPCPTPPLEPPDIETLGGDVMPEELTYDLVVTRLHARYDKAALGEDLVFRKAKPIVGGREVMMGDRLETGNRPDSVNNFQARYAIRHPWTGAIDCSEPNRGVWGGPPDGDGAPGPRAAQNLAFAPRGGATLASFVEHDVPEIDLKLDAPKQPHAAYVPPAPPSSGCASCATTGSHKSALPIAALIALLGLLFARRRRRASRGTM